MNIATLTPDEQAIAQMLQSYFATLNASDTDAAVSHYAPDGVFMPPYSPSSVGLEAVRSAYAAVFRAITLAVTVEIAEIHQLAPDWAFARTNSAGTVTVHATGASGPEANQELFVLRKLGGEWKIARYCFSSTNPPRA